MKPDRLTTPEAAQALMQPGTYVVLTLLTQGASVWIKKAMGPPLPDEVLAVMNPNLTPK